MTRDECLGNIPDAPEPVREAVLVPLTDRWTDEVIALRSQGMMIASLRKHSLLPHYTLCDYATAVRRVGHVMGHGGDA